MKRKMSVRGVLFFIFLLQSLLIFPCCIYAADSVNSSSIELSVGQIPLSTTYSPYNSSMTIAVGMPTLDQGIFFPILSSPSFNSSDSSQRRGFSLGFYFSPINFITSFTPCSDGCDIYMAVCVGSSGNTTNIEQFYLPEAGDSFVAYRSTDGFVVPVWIANLGKPIRDLRNASLGVVSSSNNNRRLELQLKDDEVVLWNVSNVGIMEMQDTGDLLIFDSPSSSNLVWQSSNQSSDTLVEGQSLTVGGNQLTSNDSSYSARMENGGLVLYMNTAHFSNMQAPPYWIFPLLRSDADARLPMNASINQLISSAPCNSTPASALLSTQLSLMLSLQSGCSLNDVYSFWFEIPKINISWSFLRLESDGRLYGYEVSNPRGSPFSAIRYAVDSGTGTLDGLPGSISDSFPFFQWGKCDVPMACGPLGVCTPDARDLCSCPDIIAFDRINATDSTQGCKRHTNLPVCSSAGNEHINSTNFLQLNFTASIFLFSGWVFNSSAEAVDVDDCKVLCSSSCSCQGVSYQIDSSACFFLTDEISLLTVADKRLSFINYTASSAEDYKADDPYLYNEILARNYVTYLKMVSDPTANVTTASGNDGNKAATIALIVILPFIVAFLMIGLTCYLVRARRKKLLHMRLRAEEEKELQDILPLLPSRFSYKELNEATKGFSELLGAGGCGSVYAGILSDGRKVAVKALQVNALQAGAEQSKQFLAEVATVGRTSHNNIVRLFGFCWELSHRLLVYEYVEKGSLDRWLFVRKSERITSAAFLGWQTRYNVALGIARGLNYLHEECEQPIFHFDIKPQNILLGDDFVAKLADFGMSRLMKRDMTSVVTAVRGTPGYIAPEWFSHGTVSKKSDVFSMGMVMLEIVSGRRILDNSFLNSSQHDSEELREAWHFPSWAAKKCEQGLTMELVDKRLNLSGFDGQQAERLIHIAFWCIHEDPAMRPNAPTVLQWLEGISPIEYPPFFGFVNAARCLNKPALAIHDEIHPSSSHHTTDNYSSEVLSGR